MKFSTSQFLKGIIYLFLFTSSALVFAQVGINTTTPAEMLDVNGNLKLDGAFMPGNAFGGVDQILLSQGTGVPPVWGPGFINTAEISAIEKIYIGPLPAIPDLTYFTGTLPYVGLTAAAVVDVNFSGPMPAGPLYGYNFTMIAVPRANNLDIYITNDSGGAMGAGIVLTCIIYHQ